MNTEYVQTFNSFFRNGKYPLEADYIFDSEEALKLWEEDNKKYLHDGLLKVVVEEDKQTLYWFQNDTFVPLITSESLENIAYLLKDFELHGQLRDLLRDLQNATRSKLNALQQELDQTQAGAGLNGDGSFDQLNMKNTTYLDGSRSIIEAIKALDREMSNLVVGSFIKDAYYDSSTEEIVITFVSDTEKVVRIPLTNLIREWEPDNTSPTKVVEITREEVYGSGSDKVSADVRISPNQDNILEKDGNALLVRGTSDNITHGGQTLDKVIDLLDTTTKVFENYTESQKADLKVGNLVLLLNDEQVGNNFLPDLNETGIWVEDNTWWNKLYVYFRYGDSQYVEPWPGSECNSSLTINDKIYRFFAINSEVEHHIVFNNDGGTQFDGPTIIPNKNYYIILSGNNYIEVDAFQHITYYKGLYVVTPEGYKAISLDEELKETLEGLIDRVDSIESDLSWYFEN